MDAIAKDANNNLSTANLSSDSANLIDTDHYPFNYVDDPKKAKATFGERAFDGGVYWGIGWGGNAAFSVATANEVVQGSLYQKFEDIGDWAKGRPPFLRRKLSDTDIKAGAEIYKQFEEIFKEAVAKGTYKQMGIPGETLGEVTTNLEETLEKMTHEKKAHFVLNNSPLYKETLLKDAWPELKKVESFLKDKTAKSKAKSLFTLMTLMSGGFAMMVPMKLLEDKKMSLIKSIDDYWSPPEQRTSEEQQKIDARYKELEHEPDQTWLSEFAARLMVLLPVLTLHFNLAPKDNVIQKFGKIEFKGVDHHYNEWAANTGKYLRNNSATKGMMEALDKGSQRRIGNLAKNYSDHADYFQNTLGAKKRVDNLINYTMVDTSYSLGVATFTYLASRFTNELFNSGKKEKHAEQSIDLHNLNPNTGHISASDNLERAKQLEINLATNDKSEQVNADEHEENKKSRNNNMINPATISEISYNKAQGESVHI